jgi:hypothetical protein
LIRKPVKRSRDGSYQLKLSAGERDVLRDLPGQMLQLLADVDNPSLRRLFPPAYREEADAEAEAEYRRLMLGDLLERRHWAMEAMARTVDAEQLTEEDLTAWLGALNDLRLVLGTNLDVSEEDDHSNPETPAHALYYYLGYLQESVVEALSGE